MICVVRGGFVTIHRVTTRVCVVRALVTPQKGEGHDTPSLLEKKNTALPS